MPIQSFKGLFFKLELILLGMAKGGMTGCGMMTNGVWSVFVVPSFYTSQGMSLERQKYMLDTGW